jgi:L-amino acid N-acyltransferase YncA
MNIRPVEPGDYRAITDIYNHYIQHTVISFEEELLTLAGIEQRVVVCTENYPWLVCADGDKVVGYAYANRWQVRCAYRQCVETTIYLEHGLTGKGFGTALYAALLVRLARQGLHTAIAGIALPNEPSIRLHEHLGFRQVAHFTEVGYKLGQWVDVGYWQKMLEGPAGVAVESRR